MEKVQLKLNELLKAYAAENESKKKSQMISRQIQVGEDDDGYMHVKKRKTQHRKTHVDPVKKLRHEVLSL